MISMIADGHKITVAGETFYTKDVRDAEAAKRRAEGYEVTCSDERDRPLNTPRYRYRAIKWEEQLTE